MINLTDALTSTSVKKASNSQCYHFAKLQSCASKRDHKGEFLPKADEMMALWLEKAEGSRQSGKFLECLTSSHKQFRETPGPGLGRRLWKDPQVHRGEEESRKGGRRGGRGASLGFNFGQKQLHAAGPRLPMQPPHPPNSLVPFVSSHPSGNQSTWSGCRT